MEGSTTSAILYTPGIYAFLFVYPFVHLCVRHVRGIYDKVFHRVVCKFLKWGISDEPLIRKHSYLDHRYPGGSVSFHDSWPQGPCPKVGLEVKIWDTFKKCFSTFLLWKKLMYTVGQTWLSLVRLTCGSWSEGQHDLCFTVQWFCLISWRLFHVCTSYFGIMNQYDPRFDLKIKVGHCDLYFMVQWFYLVS